MRFLFLLVILGGALYWFAGFSGGSFEGLESKRHAPNEPLQKELPSPKTFKFKDDYTLTAHHSFDITALVLSRKNYSVDRESDLAPVDLALGWGPMSNPAPLKLIRISQSNRFFYFRYDNMPTVPKGDIVRNASNMHMVPSNKNVEKALKSLDKGDVIRVQGYLVDALAKDGWQWFSSRTRTDTGAGACELVYVMSVDVLK